ncbi:MAG: 5-formyltetrahydrofolate cyclo-ligase [Desulfobacterium sp.]
MHETKDSKKSILTEISERLAAFSSEEMAKKQEIIEEKLLEFANFLEAELALLYVRRAGEMATDKILRISLAARKGIVLPAFSESKHAISLFRINDLDADLKKSSSDRMEPNPDTCKKISLEDIDIAVIPGLAFDEKGGRIGFGEGFYNRLIAKLPETTRKIAIAFEEQIVEHVPMDSRKHNLDIIITDQRTIYKI